MNHERITLASQEFSLRHSWSAISKVASRLPSSLHLAVAPHSTQTCFVANTFLGFFVCSNYYEHHPAVYITTEKMQVTSIDFCPAPRPDVVISFNLGSVLLLNAVKRKTGRVLWLNSVQQHYSSRKPRVVRWVNDDEFAVVFDDATMWVFRKQFEAEDPATIEHLKARLADISSKKFVCASVLTDKNPIEAWRFALGKVTDMRFTQGPEQPLFLLTSAHGELSIFDFHQKTHLVTFQSYFAGLRCLDVCEPYVAVGGEDDAVSVWNLRSRRLVVRCEGHSSWVTGVQFTSQTGLGLASVGLDGKLLEWDLTGISPDVEVPARDAIVAYPPKNSTFVIEPAAVAHASRHPLSAFVLKANSLFLLDESGKVSLWQTQL